MTIITNSTISKLKTCLICLNSHDLSHLPNNVKNYHVEDMMQADVKTYQSTLKCIVDVIAFKESAPLS